MEVVPLDMMNSWNLFCHATTNSWGLMRVPGKPMKLISSTARGCTRKWRSWWLIILNERLTVTLKWKCSSEICISKRIGTLGPVSIYLIAKGKAISTFSVCMGSWVIMVLMLLMENSLLSSVELRVVATSKWTSGSSPKPSNPYLSKCMTLCMLKIKESTWLVIMASTQKTLGHSSKRCRIRSLCSWTILLTWICNCMISTSLYSNVKSLLGCSKLQRGQACRRVSSRQLVTRPTWAGNVLLVPIKYNWVKQRHRHFDRPLHNKTYMVANHQTRTYQLNSFWKIKIPQVVKLQLNQLDLTQEGHQWQTPPTSTPETLAELQNRTLDPWTLMMREIWCSCCLRWLVMRKTSRKPSAAWCSKVTSTSWMLSKWLMKRISAGSQRLKFWHLWWNVVFSLIKMTFITSPVALTEITIQNCCIPISVKPSPQRIRITPTTWALGNRNTYTTQTCRRRTTSQTNLETPSSSASKPISTLTRKSKLPKNDAPENPVSTYTTHLPALIALDKDTWPEMTSRGWCRKMASTRRNQSSLGWRPVSIETWRAR